MSMRDVDDPGGRLSIDKIFVAVSEDIATLRLQGRHAITSDRDCESSATGAGQSSPSSFSLGLS